MPHYRKIKVDDKEYEYVIGSCCIKIKGFPLIDHDPDDNTPITPGIIVKFIRNKLGNSNA